jgi:hypothetical protein
MMCETAKRLGVPPPCSIQNDYSLVGGGRYPCWATPRWQANLRPQPSPCRLGQSTRHAIPHCQPAPHALPHMCRAPTHPATQRCRCGVAWTQSTQHPPPRVQVYRGFDQELAEACSPRHCNVGLVCYGALAGGTLSGEAATHHALLLGRAWGRQCALVRAPAPWAGCGRAGGQAGGRRACWREGPDGRVREQVWRRQAGRVPPLGEGGC